MLGIVDTEVFNATALVGCADKTLALMVIVPMPEGHAFLVQLVRVKMITLELTVEAELGLEVCLANATSRIWEMLLEVGKHFASWHLEVDMVASGIEVNFCPLIYAFGHLLAQSAKHDIMHGWQDAALPLT